jgi:predicted negative regulator of RcsB-dependent stress response
MAAYDLEEQEQIAQVKALWAKYGNAVTWLLTIILAGVAAYMGWQYWQRKQAAEAGVVYEALEKAIRDKNVAAGKDAAGKLVSEYGKTVYGQMAALQAARLFVENKDLNSAKAQLQWVIDKGRDESYKTVARVRLAGLLLDEKQFDAALALLAPPKIDKLAPLVSDRRGDVLAAQGKLEEARAAYLDAWNKLEERDPLRGLIQQKLEGVGGEVPAAKAA